MEENVSLFDYDPETGEIVYSPGEEVTQEGSEGSENVGNVSNSVDPVGDMVENPENLEENVVETQEEPPSVDLLDSGDSGVAVVLEDEVTAAILANSPAGGSIGSSTLDYFDRVVSGLPADAAYVAYRTSADDSYDAVLYYGHDYTVSGNMIIFSDAVELEVERVNTSGYNNETNYYFSQVDDTSVTFSQSGPVIYYTNAVPGYPVLGGYVRATGHAPLITAALIGALAVVIMSKLMFRR